MPLKTADLRAQLDVEEEDDQEELLAALHAMQAKKVRANLKQQEGLVAQGADLVTQYQESVRKLVEEEEGAIQPRIQQYDEEEARIAKEARETEKTLLDLLHSQSTSVRSATDAIEQELVAEREDNRKIAHNFVQVTQGEEIDVDDVAPALWRMSSDQDGGDAMDGVED
ncbi:hypothetical protein RTG_02229 [Rhodotorula toruloides ATCC 204091]|uniref:Uncharacterized protein n=1 Tax=Rhodotorula toruloides TaxID=5286 RepID=A0A0K3CH24_RHOTO|nr:hypothetical protein RTG_02229 [Rhodotorula toruloides ATCC 204091]PRQ75588.1 hypothetical protein AAT19DRAFT_13645 [Rhodotorula toruloides]